MGKEKILMNKSKIIILLGVVCMIASLVLFGYNFYEDYQANQYVHHVLDHLIFDQQDNTYEVVPQMEMNVSFIDDIGYIGVLELEQFDLTLPIINECNDDYLKIAPCCMQGSIYTKDMIIAGHNYSSHFGKLGLLKLGSKITFMDMNQNQFEYQVVDLFKINGNDYDKLISLDYDLVLFTCTLSRTQRIVIGCMQIN